MNFSTRINIYIYKIPIATPNFDSMYQFYNVEIDNIKGFFASKIFDHNLQIVLQTIANSFK